MIRMSHPVLPLIVFHLESQDGSFTREEIPFPESRMEGFADYDTIADVARLNGWPHHITDHTGIKVLWARGGTGQYDEDLADRIEGGTATLTDLMRGIALARHLSDQEMVAYDIFGPDDSNIVPIRDIVVHGRKDLEDNASRLPIQKGERHRKIVEIVEGEWITTRHCELNCWLSKTGRGIVWNNFGDQVQHHRFIALYVEARDALDALETEGRI